MLTLNDGRNELWQWDTGRSISVDADCSQVHFGRNVYGRSINVDVVDGIAKVPDVLLQIDKPITAWAFIGTPGNGYTKISKEFVVNKRNKPADYVFTQEEQITLRNVIKRLEDVEENQNPEAIAKIVNDYLEENPVESPVQSVNGKTGKVHLNAEDVGALPKDTKIPKEYVLPLATSDTLGGIKADPVENTDTQPVRIGADGKLYTTPGGGGENPTSSKWKFINEISVSETVESVTIDADSDGNAISAKHLLVYMYLPKYELDGVTGTGYSTYAVNGKNISAGNGYCYPSAEWDNAHFLFDIMACGDLVYVRCYRQENGDNLMNGKGVKVFHFAINENKGLYEAITSFRWSLFGRKVLAGSKFKVYGEVL